MIWRAESTWPRMKDRAISLFMFLIFLEIGRVLFRLPTCIGCCLVRRRTQASSRISALMEVHLRQLSPHHVQQLRLLLKLLFHADSLRLRLPLSLSDRRSGLLSLLLVLPLLV